MQLNVTLTVLSLLAAIGAQGAEQRRVPTISWAGYDGVARYDEKDPHTIADATFYLL